MSILSRYTEKLIQKTGKKRKLSCPDKQEAKLFKRKWKVLKKEENFGSLVLINRKQIEISMKKKKEKKEKNENFDNLVPRNGEANSRN